MMDAEIDEESTEDDERNSGNHQEAVSVDLKPLSRVKPIL
jgi:hypothetical protein